MKPPHPPLLATSLLRWLVAKPHSEALQGDLIEGWRGGRSYSWYWRQVLIAVCPVRGTSVNPSTRLAITVAILVVTALAALLIITLSVVIADREARWWSLVPTMFGLLASLLAVALQRRRKSGQ